MISDDYDNGTGSATNKETQSDKKEDTDTEVYDDGKINRCIQKL